MPHGEFVKIARTHDPLWGMPANMPKKKYKAEVEFSRTEYDKQQIDVEAYTEELAKIAIRAEALAIKKSEGWEDFGIGDVKEVEV